MSDLLYVNRLQANSRYGANASKVDVLKSDSLKPPSLPALEVLRLVDIIKAIPHSKSAVNHQINKTNKP